MPGEIAPGIDRADRWNMAANWWHFLELKVLTKPRLAARQVAYRSLIAALTAACLWTSKKIMVVEEYDMDFLAQRNTMFAMLPFHDATTLLASPISTQ